MAQLSALLDDSTELEQPPHFSSMLPFPFNARVDHAALWALRSIIDGEAPFPQSDLANNGARRPADSWFEEARTAYRKWWAQRVQQALYKLPG